MPFRRALRTNLAGLGLAAAVAAGPAAAETSTYDLSISGVHLGTVTLRADLAGSEYRAASKITPNGLVSAVTSYAFDGRARGWVDASGKVSPGTFRAESSSPRAKRKTEIVWQGETPVHVSVVPPRRHAPDPARAVGALDPVSAGFALLRVNAPEAICDTSVDVFDGSRRSRLTVGKAEAANDGYRCAGTYSQLEGEAHSLSNQSSYPFTLTFVPNGAGKVRLERIETRTRFGPAVVARRG
jgi:hypothetical protein